MMEILDDVLDDLLRLLCAFCVALLAAKVLGTLNVGGELLRGVLAGLAGGLALIVWVVVESKLKRRRAASVGRSQS